MRRSTAALALALLAAPAGAIVGGQPAPQPDGVRRHTVLILGGSSRCTGAVVDRDLVLTAAHCFVGGRQFKVVAYGPDRVGRTIDIQRVETHPGFQEKGQSVRDRGVDLAIVRLASLLPDDMAPVAIGTMVKEETVRIAGYGVGVEGQPGTANILRHALLVGKPTDAGRSVVILAVGAGVNEVMTGVGACSGDSGGPMFSEESQKLVGIIGSGIPLPGRRGWCGGYTAATRVADHWDWIVASAGRMRQAPIMIPAPPPRPVGRQPERLPVLVDVE